MPPVRFKQVDVFTRTPFRGNPVAVVLGAEGLSGEAMQRIAGSTSTRWGSGGDECRTSYRAGGSLRR